MAAAIARHVGARHVVITDVNDYRLDLARTMGATRAVNVERENLHDVMEDLRMTEGFDVGMEMSGVPTAFSEMLRHMNHGGKIALLGIPPSNMAIDWNQVIFKGLEIKGIYGREMFETWYKMAAMLQSGLDLVADHHPSLRRRPVRSGVREDALRAKRQGDPRLGGLGQELGAARPVHSGAGCIHSGPSDNRATRKQVALRFTFVLCASPALPAC